MTNDCLRSGATGVLLALVVGCQNHEQSSRLLSPGATPPDLSGIDQHGQTHHLSELRGHYAVVYFYPKDDTPGCTKEACAFRDVWNQYRASQVPVLGVSVDDESSHASFAKKYFLPFPIIADSDKQWVTAFGVHLNNGRASRVSFILAPDGKVGKVYANVDPGTHANLVLSDIHAQMK